MSVKTFWMLLLWAFCFTEAPAWGEEAFQPQYFLPDPELDRSKIPVIQSGLLGTESSDCVPRTVCNFLLWWDRENFLRLHYRGDFNRKSEWIHGVMERYLKTCNATGTCPKDAVNGIDRYFSRYLYGQATCQIIRTVGVSPKMLAHYTTGPNAVALSLSVYYGQEKADCHWVAVVTADKNGGFVFNTWGTQFKGTLKKFDSISEWKITSGQKFLTEESDGTNYIIQLDGEATIPSWMKSRDVSFRIEPKAWNGLFVIVPLRLSSPRFAGTKPPAYPKSSSGDR